jgi:hypothetical protein
MTIAASGIPIENPFLLRKKMEFSKLKIFRVPVFS